MQRYLVIEGNIGAGKTSLCKLLAPRLKAHLVLEQFEDNPFLPKFYADPERYNFTLELSFLAARYRQLNEEVFSAKQAILSDYYFIKSLIFAKTTLQNDELKLYEQIFDMIYQQLPKPDLYVYLHRDTEKLLAQIKNRGRSYEQNIQGDYLNRISEHYRQFLQEVNSYPVLFIDCNTLDYMGKAADLDKIQQTITQNTYQNGFNSVQL